ncbi:MAG: glycosyltransferase family 4 protein, partial [Acidobacteriota bacterium]
GAWTAVIAKAAFGTPLVVRCGFLWADFVARLTSSRLRRWVARALEGLAVRSADRVVVAAAADAARIIDRYHVDPARVTVIPNYVDTARFRPDDGVVPDAGHILFVGRLEDQKNPALLIDAARTVPGVHITVVGDGPLRADLESLAQANGVAVHFAGRLAHDALAGLFRRAQVFVLPSRYEGNPKVLVEAMACGVPVVGTRVPGIADVIADRQNGLLCDSSVESLRAAMVELLRDAGLRTRLANAGRRYVEAHCSLGAAVASERALLEGITSS